MFLFFGFLIRAWKRRKAAKSTSTPAGPQAN
jgi:hypothetical protein